MGVTSFSRRYKSDPQIVAMTDMVNAYQRKELREVEKILRENRATILGDPFIRTYIDDVLKNIRTQVLIKLIKPYTRIEIPFVSKVRLPLPIFTAIVDGRVLTCLEAIKHIFERG